MPSRRWPCPAARTGGLLAALALLGLLAQGGSLPHLHVGAEPGLWNQEHDLVLLATLSASAVAAKPSTPPVPTPPVATVVPAAPGRPATAGPGLPAPRAPPVL